MDQGSIDPALAFVASDGAEFTFASVEDAISFVNNERAALHFISSGTSGSARVQQAASVFAAIDALARLQADAAANTGTPNERASRVRAVLVPYLGLKPAIHARTALRDFLVAIARRSESEAAWALVWLAYAAGTVRDVDAVGNIGNQRGAAPGLASAWQWLFRDLTATEANAAAERASALAKLAGASADAAASAALRAQGHVADLDAAISQARATMDSGTAEVREFGQALQAQLDEVLSSERVRLDSMWRTITDTYEQQLQLNAPASYWKGKHAGHRTLAWRFGIASAVAAAAGTVGLWVGLPALLGQATINTLMTWRQALSLGVSAVIFLWVLKTFVRMTMSHVHLMLDAQERRVMISSYLAMTKRGETKGDERAALFAAIFRPTGDGLVKDETPPLPLWEMLKGGKP